MKAVVLKGSGSADKLILSEFEDPVPKDNELLIKVHAGTVTRGDVFLRKIPAFIVVPLGLLLGFKRMKIPGIEFSGTVEGTGRSVTLFKKGDRVFGTTTGLGYGANAEYVCVPEKRKSGVVARMPENLSFEEAAAIAVGGMTALYNLRKANVGQGRKVLIYGASGSVGTFAIQLAKHLGAEVVGVCSTRNVDLVKSLGADRVIDYTKDDFTAQGQKYDFIFDAVGKISRAKCRGSLEENGTYRSIRTPTKEKTEDLVFLKTLAAAGHLRSVIDRQYTLDQVPEAHKYVELGHKRGNVVIRIVGEESDFQERQDH